MASVHRERGFDFQIYFNDHGEPHVHVWKAGRQAKITIGNMNVPPDSIGGSDMKTQEVRRAVRIVERQQSKLLAKWREYHA